MPVGALGIALGLGLLAGNRPLLAVMVGVAALLALAILSLPDVATLVVLFILYTNAAVVAVRFHGVPTLVSAALPALLIIPLAYYIVVRRQKLIITPALPWLLVFLFVQMIGALFSKNPVVSLASLTSFLIEGLGLYFLLINVIRTSEMLRRVIWVLLIAGALLGSLSIYQEVTHTYNNNYGGFAQMSNGAFNTGGEDLYGEVTQRRLAGPLGDQNRYAQNMLMLVPLGLFRFWGERSKVLRLLAACTTSVIALGAVLTFSRGAAIAFVLVLAFMVLMRYIKPGQFLLILLGVGVLMQALPQYSARLTSLDTVFDAATNQGGTTIQATDTSTQGRVTEMLTAAMVYADYPVIGVGPGMYRYYYQDYAERVGIRTQLAARQAHDLYLGLAAENGTLGLVAFGLIVFMTLRDLVRARRHWMQSQPAFVFLSTGFMLSVVSYLTTGIFLHFAYIRYFWLIMALAGAAGYIAANSTEAADERKGVAAL